MSAVAATTGRIRRNSRTASSAPVGTDSLDNATSTHFNLLPQRIVTFMNHASPAISPKFSKYSVDSLRSVNIIVTAHRNVSSRSSSLGSRGELKDLRFTNVFGRTDGFLQRQLVTTRNAETQADHGE